MPTARPSRRTPPQRAPRHRRGTRRIPFLAALGLLASLVGATPVRADIIRLKNGRKLQGEVIEDESDEDWLVLKIRAGRLRIRRSDIKERISQSRDATLLGVGTRLSRNGDHGEAVAALREALTEASAGDPVDKERLDTIRRRLAWALSRRGKAMETEGQVGAAVEDYAEAAELVPGESASAAAIRRLQADLARSREALEAATLLADTGELDEAIRRVEALLEADPRFDGRADGRLARWRAQRADRRMMAAARAGRALSPGELGVVLTDYRRAVALDSGLLDRIGPRWATTVCLLSLNPAAEGRQAARHDLPRVAAALPGTVHGQVARAILVEQGHATGDKVALWKAAAGPDAVDDPTETRQRAVKRMLKATSLKDPAESRRPTLSATADIKTEHFVVRHRNPELGRRVAVVAEHWWRRLLPGYERPMTRVKTGRITITLTHGPAERRGEDLEILGTTRIAGPAGQPHLLTIHAGADHPELVTAVIPHEITHALLAVIVDSAELPRWFQEGLATLHEPPIKRRRYRSLLARAHRLRRPVPVRRLLGEWRLRSGDEGMSFYAHSLALVQELIRRGGLDRLIKLGRRLIKEPSAAVLKSAYELESLDELDKAIAGRARRAARAGQGGRK